MVTHQSYLNMVPDESNTPIIHVSQYDSNFTIEFFLIAVKGEFVPNYPTAVADNVTFSVESGTTVEVRGTKKDGNGYSANASISGKKVTVTGNEQMTAISGENIYEIVLKYNDKEVSTANFILDVERAALDKDTVQSASVIREIIDTIDRTDEFLGAAHSISQDRAAVAEMLDDTEDARDAAQAAQTAAETAQSGAATSATAAAQSASDAASILAAAETAISTAKADALTAIAGDKADALTDLETSRADGVASVEEAESDAMEAIEARAAQIVAITTSAESIATEALTAANNAENHMATLDSQMQDVRTALNNVSIDPDDLGLYQDEDTMYVYPTYKGVVSENGIPLASKGGGGGGGEVITAVLTVENTSGWLSKTISAGSSCPVSFNWSSIDDGIATGPGTMRITVNEIVRSTQQIEQGALSVDLKPYLAAGANKVKVRISDSSDQGKTITFNITSMELTISSSFDSSQVYTSTFAFPYTPVGAVSKTVYFYLDGIKLGEQETAVSGRQMNFPIPAQSHGAHSLRVYFEAEINNETVRSNELYFEFVYAEPLNNTVIITSNFSDTERQQYDAIPFSFNVYDPANIKAPEVSLYANGNLVATLKNVERGEQSYTYRANTAGTLTFRIESGGTSKTITLTITESQIDVEAETEALALYLTSQGRSNSEEHPEVWRDEENEISANLTGFGWTSDGWQSDEDGITCLRVSGDARVAIPYQLFGTDFRTPGKTIEIEFATRNVLDYDAPILTCMSGGRGLSLTAQSATLSSEQSTIGAQYKEDEHIRLSFVAQKASEDRLLMIYIDSIPSGVIQYPQDDNFQQANPVGISIGSNDCTIDIYTIRVYDNDLTKNQILDNWIADTQIGSLMLERYTRNQIYDTHGTVITANLPSSLPYMILEADELSQYKGDKKTISVQYVNPLYPSMSFTANNVKLNVQGTTSARYEAKNYDQQYNGGFEMSNGSHADSYHLKAGDIPFNRFVLKADVASSEGANNVELVKLYNDACPYKTPAMEDNPLVRWGIDGYPIAAFWSDTATGEVKFIGKYNFNLPKRAPAPYGYAPDSEDTVVANMESWESQNNTSELMLFQSDYFNEEMRTDPDTGETKEAWRFDYEARFPTDEYTDYSGLQEFQSFVYSTWRDNATGDALPESVTYEGTTYTNDTAEYRLAKFRAEFPNYAELDSFLFYYIFTELFLLMDSRAKNLFIGFNGSRITDANRSMKFKATAQPYDMDSGLGTNNEGTLTYGYSLEDTDPGQIFTGQSSVLWNNIRDAYPTRIRQMYQELRSAGTLSYAETERRYEEHQGKWPEAIWIEDEWIKYLNPLIAPAPGKNPTSSYLSMLQGSKEQQRKRWLINRFRYMDSKWHAGEALLDPIYLRAYSRGNITVTPYFDLYPSVRYASYTVTERGVHGQASTLVCPAEIASFYDTEIYIYSAPQIALIGDLSPLKLGLADLSNAANLQEIKIGDSDSQYDNQNLYQLDFGANVLLKKIDVRNCSGLGDTTLQGHTQTTLDISGCSIIEEVYLEGTKLTGVSLPNGGNLRKLHLPDTTTNLTVLNQKNLTEFVLSDYSNIRTLRIENSASIIPVMSILNAMDANSRVRLIGFSMAATSEQDVEDFYDLLDTMTGLDEMGRNVDTAQVEGVITGLGTITGSWYAEMLERYPYIRIEYEHIGSKVFFYNGTTKVGEATAIDGGDVTYTGTTPTKTQDAQYTYTFAGWSKDDDNTVDADALTHVVADRNVYACFTSTLRKYTVTFVRSSTDGGGTLQTISNVNYGTSVTAANAYTGSTPTTTQGSATDYPFEGWNPASAVVQGNTVFTAKFGSPVEDVEITDSWDTIIANIDNGTYSTRYKVGNYKPLDLGTTYGTVNMQIVAKDSDELASGGTAPLTFLAKELLLQDSGMNTSSISANGYPATNVMKPLLDNTIYPLIPSNIKERIQRVNKTYYDCTTTSTLTSVEKLWIPSAREMFGSTSYESSGVMYTTIFKNNTARIKNKDGSAYYYWLRSAYDAYGFRYVRSGGDVKYGGAILASGVCLGFCLGLELETITDSWSTILANQNYATDYSIGDTKMLDLGTEGKHLMEIVAFDEDNRADGNGKAGITWISKTLLNTGHRMNATNTTEGGWEDCEMRTYLKNTIKPLIPETVRNAIVPVTKVQSTYTGGAKVIDGQTTTDDVWIPGHREVFNAVPYESTGAVYSNKFNSNTNRIKKRNGSAYYWWLRSAYSASGFRDVGSDGSGDYSSASYSDGVALGFCTN